MLFVLYVPRFNGFCLLVVAFQILKFDAIRQMSQLMRPGPRSMMDALRLVVRREHILEDTLQMVSDAAHCPFGVSMCIALPSRHASTPLTPPHPCLSKPTSHRVDSFFHCLLLGPCLPQVVNVEPKSDLKKQLVVRLLPIVAALVVAW